MAWNVVLALFFVLLLIVLGVQSYRGKLTRLMADYLAQNAQGKKQLDEKFLGKIQGGLAFIFAGLAGGYILFPKLQTFLLLAQIIVLFSFILYLNITPKKFKN